jgi:hypothetical protein
MWFINIAPSNVIFKKEQSVSELSLVLLLEIQGYTYVMKVVSKQIS